MKLAQQVIAAFDAPLDLADYKDEYRERLQRIIDAKIAGEEIVAQEIGDASESRQPDGRAEKEPRRRQYRQKETSESRGSPTRREAQTSVGTPQAQNRKPRHGDGRRPRARARGPRRPKARVKLVIGSPMPNPYPSLSGKLRFFGNGFFRIRTSTVGGFGDT
jgi:hypothetical protein